MPILEFMFLYEDKLAFTTFTVVHIRLLTAEAFGKNNSAFSEQRLLLLSFANWGIRSA